MNVGVNKSMAPPAPPAKTGAPKQVKLNAMPWFHGKVYTLLKISHLDIFMK